MTRRTRWVAGTGGVLATLLVVATAGSASADPAPSVVWSDPVTATSQSLYTHGAVLKHNGSNNGTALVTYEGDIFSDPAEFPIFRSTNAGTTWTHVTDVQDVVANRGLRQQPTLYELPRASGNLPAGTILLAGNAEPLDQSSTSLVLYTSINAGSTWSYLSTIDTGGPAVYDPSPTSTTSAVWEPEIYLASNNELVVSYSDERQKANGVLQALVHRVSTNGGQTWGSLVNDIAIPDTSTRPGMMSVVPLPDGRFFAAYEVVGYPDVPVYGRFSTDGLNWGNPTDIGFKLQTPNGSFLFGSPQVTWTPTGGSNGTIIVNGGRFITPVGQSKSMFLTSTSLGSGAWTPVPQPVQATGDINAAAQYSQSTDTTLDEKRLIQFTSVLKPVKWHDVVTATMPMNSTRYAAASAILTNAQLVSRSASVAANDVGYINFSNSSVAFNSVTVPTAGPYNLRIRYSNGTNATSSHSVSVNGAASITVSYPRTYDWNGFQFVTVPVTLAAGSNSITFRYAGTFAELDQIEIYP